MFRFLLTLAVMILILPACGRLPPATGRNRDVVAVSVVVDSTLVQTLQIWQRFPQTEAMFNFIYVPDTAFKRYQNFRNILIYGSLPDRNISRLLNAEARAAIVRDNFALFKKHDLWARDQLVLILVTAEPQLLWETFKEFRPLISRILEDEYRQRLKRDYYATPLDDDLKNCLRKYGWSIDLHRGWLIDTTQAGNGFLFVHAHDPDRSIFYWREPGSRLPSDTAAIKKRNELTRRFYHGDYVVNGTTISSPVSFQGKSALRLQGVWQNDSLVAGGPFVTYFFPAGDTLCIVDGILFLPGERKTEMFIKLDIALNSFQALSPASNDRRP